MTKDYSGKNLSRKALYWILVINFILLVCALWLLVANIRYNEITSAIAMGLVAVVAIFNGVVSILRLRGKKI